MFVDVHTHIIHPQFEGEEEAVAIRAKEAGLTQVIVNGLEPQSNRAVLALCAKHSHLFPALGIYPVDAIAAVIPPEEWTYDFDPPTPFDVDLEIDFIDSKALELIAIGEIGLDQYWIKSQSVEQERVFRRLITVAQKHDLPIIIHSRKAEARCFEILQEMNVEKANFHCYCGKLKLAKRIADAGYYFSIPPVVERADSFQRLSKALPLTQLLTETDAPYMGPDRGERNEPMYVPRGVKAMAMARGIDDKTMALAIRENFRRLFGC